MENKKILVTGGGGFLGKAIVKKLIAKKAEVHSFSRQFYPELEKMGVKQIQGDIADAASVKAALKGMEIVFHVAAKAGIWGAFDEYYKSNVIGTENIISACFENKLEHLIYTSSPSVIFNGSDMENVDESFPYPEKYTAAYPQTKAMAEKLVCRACEKGLRAVILRPHLIWGPEDNHLVPGIIKRAGRLRSIGRKDDLVDTIYIDNAAHAHILASVKLVESAQNQHSSDLSDSPDISGNIYFISQDEPVSKWKMASAFLEAAGLPPVKGHISAKSAYIAAYLIEKIYSLLSIKKEPPITRFAAEELATSHWFNISRAKNDLGYFPEISIKEGLERLKESLR